MIYGGIFLFGFHPEASVLALGAMPLLVAFLFFCLVVVPVLRELLPGARLVPALDALLRRQLGLQHLALPRRAAPTKLDEAREGGRARCASSSRSCSRTTTAVEMALALLARAPLHAPRGTAAARGAARAPSTTSTTTSGWRARCSAACVLGWNFGDGHLNDTQLLDAVQEQCGFEAGELRVVMVESQPLFGRDDALEGRRRGDRRDRRGRDGDRADARRSSPGRRASTPKRCCAAARPRGPERPNGCPRPRSRCRRDRLRARTGSPPRSRSRARARRVRVIEAADEIGGGTRSAELTLPGFVHDVCSAVHPMGILSPFFRHAAARRARPRVAPSAGFGRASDATTAGAVLLYRSLDETARGLGRDGRRYARLVGPFSTDPHALLADVARAAADSRSIRSDAALRPARRLLGEPARAAALSRRPRRARCSRAAPRTRSSRSPSR